jgi:GDPmannose 4,6-dehydratase
MPTAIITGITGQDGSYLAEFLLAKGYEVVGMVRRSSTVTFERIQHIQDDLTLIQGDLHDQSSLVDVIERYRPDEVYNLAAQSFVPTSWNQPVLTGEVTALGVTRLLEAIRLVNPKRASTRLPRARCSARYTKCRRTSGRRFTAARMAWLKFTRIGSQSIIGILRFVRSLWDAIQP